MRPALADIFTQIPGGSIRPLPDGGLLCIDAVRSPDAPAPTLCREAPWRWRRSAMRLDTSSGLVLVPVPTRETPKAGPLRPDWYWNQYSSGERPDSRHSDRAGTGTSTTTVKRRNRATLTALLAPLYAAEIRAAEIEHRKQVAGARGRDAAGQFDHTSTGTSTSVVKQSPSKRAIAKAAQAMNVGRSTVEQAQTDRRRYQPVRGGPR